MEWLGYLGAVGIGLVLGMMGGGGSILSIPILVYLFNLDPVTASAYSLFIVGITSLVGVIPKYKQHLVDLRRGLWFGIPSIISIFSTRRWIIPAIPDQLMDSPVLITKRMLLLGTFGLLMILAAFPMIRQRTREGDGKKDHVALLVLEGLLIGSLTGLVGAGGGFLIIPALIFLTGLKFKSAVGTSLFIIALNSLLGFTGDVINLKIDWMFLLSITAMAVFGILLGNRMSGMVSGTMLRRLFGLFTLTMGLFIILQEVFLN